MARQKSADSKPLSRRVLVVIDRDMTEKTSKVIWQHEMPILEAIFGEGKVELKDPKILDDGFSGKQRADLLPYNKVQDEIRRPSESVGVDWVFCGDAQVEYSRLEAAYGKDSEKGQAFVEMVYGRFQEGRFAAVVGRAEVEDLPDPQLRDLVRSYGFVPPVSPESPESDKQLSRERQKALLAASQPELLKFAEELGVTLD